MVLNEAFNDDPSPPDSFANDGPYSTSRYRYSVESLPKNPIFPFATEETIRKSFDRVLESLDQQVGRRVRDEEAQAYIHSMARASQITICGMLFGVGAGLWRMRLSRNTCQMPFFNFGRLGFTPEQTGPLRGNYSRNFWKVARVTGYSLTGGFLGMLLIGTEGSTVHMHRLRTDPALKDIHEAFQKKRSQAVNARSQQQQPPTGRQAGLPQGSAQAEPQDDMSPSTIPDAYGSYKTDASPDTGVLSDTQRTQYERKVDTSAQRYPSTSPVSRPSQQSQRTPQPSAPSPALDDDSPTGGMGLFPDPDSSRQSSSGSAWDRVRQNSSSQTPNQAQSTSTQGSWQQARQQRSGVSNNEDGYRFESSDGKRELSKDEAQRQFDAQVERERRGEENDKAGRLW